MTTCRQWVIYEGYTVSELWADITLCFVKICGIVEKDEVDRL